MRVVQLDSDLLRKSAPVGSLAPKTSHDVGKGAGDQKIFLYKAQTLPQTGRVVRVEDSGEGFRSQSLCYGADEIAVAELLKVKLVRRGGAPQS